MMVPYTDSPFQIELSFDQLIHDLERRVGSKEAKDQEKYLLQQVNAYPQLRNGIKDAEELESHKSILADLLKPLFPALLSENEIKAVNIPYTNIFFNHTKRFQNILKAAGSNFEINIRDFSEHQFYIMSCCIILNEHYGTQLDFSKPLFYDVPDTNGNVKHYRILYNADFLDIVPTAMSVALTDADIEQLIDNFDDIALWKKFFPSESYLLKGFAIINLFDATIENAVSIFKENFSIENAKNLLKNTESILKTIYKVTDIHCGLMLYNDEQDVFSKPSFAPDLRSYLLQDTAELIAINALHADLHKLLFTSKRNFALASLDNVSHLQEDNLFKKTFSKYKGSLILAPIILENKVIGILEILCPRDRMLNSINAQKLEIFMPYFSEGVQELIIEHKNRVQAIIQDQYTTIHKSVYWRFRQEVEAYIQKREKNNDYKLDEIIFNDVYPLYGQIDIKGSSETRNRSIQLDLKEQLTSVCSILKNIRTEHNSPPDLPESIMTTERYLSELIETFKASTEQEISTFLLQKIHPLLKSIKTEKLQDEIKEYFKNTLQKEGFFHFNRRRYDETITTINDTLSKTIDKRQVEAQQIIPHYYERFKTDGIDHNLYVGISISPETGFTARHLYALRFWQLETLSEMIESHKSQQAALPYPLGVTGLILVYHSPISIRFRMDEKRFDVDGTYNARYEIVKKRIDKAFIKNTKKRIVQEGKITIVYSSETEEIEYLGYIERLKSKKGCDFEINKFEIEDLQNISGLKAIQLPAC